MSKQNEQPFLSSRIAAFVGVILFAVHLLTVVRHFPWQHMSATDPLSSGDLSINLGKSWDMAAANQSIGYSPNYMAGYPVGIWNSVGARGYEIGTRYLPFGTPPANFQLTVMLMASLSPLLIALAGWAAGLRFTTMLACLGGASVVMQFCDPISYFWMFGNTGFVFASSGAVLAMGLALPRHGQLRLGRALAAGIVAGVMVISHTVSMVPVACGGLAAAIICLHTGVPRFRLLTAIAIVVATALAIASPVYVPMLRYLDLRAAMPIQPLPSGLKYMMMDLFNDRAFGHPMDRRALFHVLLVLAGWAAWQDWRTQTGTATGFALAGGMVLLFGYIAGHVPGLKELQPYRFVVSGEIFLIVPAVIGLGHLGQMFRDANPPGRFAVIAVLLILLPGLTGYLLDAKSRGRARGLDPDSLACASWFRSQPVSGRVLCQPSALGALFPHITRWPVIGGELSGQAVVVQNWAHIGESQGFGQAWNKMNPAEFLRIIRALDIRLIVTETPEFDLYVRTLPASLSKVNTFGPLTVYKLAPAPSPDIWEGVSAGKVTAEYNRIRVIDPPVGSFVLPYHYVKGFRSEPGVEIEPHQIPGAAAPFVKIRVPEQRSVIELVFAP